MDTYAGDGGLHSIHDSKAGVNGETTTYVRDSLGRLVSSRGEGEKATQYSYDENNRLTRWVYTIPTLSSTAMHYVYNTDTTDDVSEGMLEDVTLFDGNRVLYQYDYLQRQSRKIIKEKPAENESVEDKRTILEENYAYAPGTGENTTTNRVSTKRVLWNNALIHQFQHGYDALGNITSVFDAHTGKRVNYTYDDQGQLLQANHIENGTTVTRIERYTYDNVGNILTFNNGTTSHTYTYGDTQWHDLLTAVDGSIINYDASGNPTSYYNGERYTMTWVEGRRLETVTIGTNTYTYEYNADGQRVKKTNPDGSYIEYYVVNGVTVGESHFSATGSKTLGIRYTLDENNSVIGFTTGGVNYYFAKNLQGDVLEVYNASTNEVVAQYTYDSWGNILTATGTLAETNPFRYRSYYYDEETNFYYLQSRYYDAAIVRFVNADVYSSTGQGLLGNNMYAYCNCNPINFLDSAGTRMTYVTLDDGAPCGFASPTAASLCTRSGGKGGSIWRDIKQFFTNTDEKAVLESDYIAFYNGVPVVRINGNRSGYFGVIFLTYETNYRKNPEDMVRHEYGHALQMKEIGLLTYATNIFLPSWLEWGSNPNYYSREVEVTADILGGVTSRTHSPESVASGFSYLDRSDKYGIFAWTTIK